MIDIYDVVVVGAGAAGVGAMRELRRSRCSSLCLEASERVGGRGLTITPLNGESLDLGCGWLHSAERNPWTAVAGELNAPIDRRENAWGIQHRELGFSQAEQGQARRTLRAWRAAMMNAAAPSDCALDAAAGTDPSWHSYLSHVAALYTGKRLKDISIADYMAYLSAEASGDWRMPKGFGQLIANAFPEDCLLRLGTPVTGLELLPCGVSIATAVGKLTARTVILTVSTDVLASGLIELPSALDAWRSAARDLSLGTNEKLFLEIVGNGPFEPETRVIGDPRSAETGAYYVRPIGMSVVEGFYGGEAAERLVSEGPAAAFDFAIGELANLYGSTVRKSLRPLAASRWRNDRWIQGGYSCARPGRSAARQDLAKPFESRIFFAGEATLATDFSTAHGAFESGKRAAAEALGAITPLLQGTFEV